MPRVWALVTLQVCDSAPETRSLPNERFQASAKSWAPSCPRQIQPQNNKSDKSELANPESNARENPRKDIIVNVKPSNTKEQIQTNIEYFLVRATAFDLEYVEILQKLRQIC